LHELKQSGVTIRRSDLGGYFDERGWLWVNQMLSPVKLYDPAVDRFIHSTPKLAEFHKRA
jgi:hypothetical protein